MNLLKAILFWLIIELLLIIPGGAVELFIQKGANALLKEYATSLGFLSSLAIIVFVLYFFFLETLKKTSSLVFFSWINLKAFAISFFSITILFCAIVFLGNQIGLCELKSPTESPLTLNITLAILCLAFVSSITEEFIFRGIIGTFFLKNIEKLPTALIISFLFSVGHLQYEGLLPFVTVFCFSLSAFFMLYKTSSLYGPIGLHTGWNLSYYLFDKVFDLEKLNVPIWGNLFELLQIGIMILLLLIICSINQKHKPIKQHSNI